MPQTHTVHDYATGEELDGTPSQWLIAASLAEPTGTGAVRAVKYDRWEPCGSVALLGYDKARTVYVRER